MSEQLELFAEKPEEADDYVTVAKIGDIPDGQGRPYEVGNRVIAVFRRGDDYFAIDDFCPHQGASLAGGQLEGCMVACPWHYWRFDVTDGRWLDSPKIKIDTFSVRVVGRFIQVRPQPCQT